MEANNAPVELTLLGIDKIWVRSTNGQWKEKGIEDQPKKVNRFNQDDSLFEGKKWWQFWKKG